MRGANQRWGLAMGLLSSAFCLGAGLWVLTRVGLDRGDDFLATGIGLYFVGKAFFVGPMLILTGHMAGR